MKKPERSRRPDPQAILELTARYETWSRVQTIVVPEDLARKHVEMSKSPFPFLRATYYAWAHLWPEVFPSEAAAPRVTAVGDLHMENFDLVRLATSALLARKESKLQTDAAELADVFLEDLEARPRGWLLQSASVMAGVMKDGYAAWAQENPKK